MCINLKVIVELKGGTLSCGTAGNQHLPCHKQKINEHGTRLFVTARHLTFVQRGKSEERPLVPPRGRSTMFIVYLPNFHFGRIAINDATCVPIEINKK
jgi:hypothetical protein